MKKLHMSSCILVTLLLISFNSFAKKRVKIGYYSLPPHSLDKKGVPTGAAIKYIDQEIYPSSHFEIQWSYYPFARLLSQLENGHIDCAILVAKTKKRDGFFKYPGTHLYQTKSGIITLGSGKYKKIKKISELKNLTIGHVVGSVQPRELKSVGVIFDNITGKDYTKRNLNRLVYGRIDGVYAPTISHVKYIMKDFFDEKKINFNELPLEGYKLFITFNRKTSKEDLDYFDKINKKKNHKYSEYLNELEANTKL